jgi:hypothetical protein
MAKSNESHAPVEFSLRIDGARVPVRGVYRNAPEIEKKLRELLSLISPDLGLFFCAELVPGGEILEMDGGGDFTR